MPRRLDARLRVVGVHVDDGNLEALRQVARVQGAADFAGAAVKPTWLLAMMWMVPPVRKPSVLARLSVSATMPCPGKAASP